MKRLIAPAIIGAYAVLVFLVSPLLDYWWFGPLAFATSLPLAAWCLWLDGWLQERGR